MKHLLLIAFLIFSIKISSQNLQNLTVHHTDNTTTLHTGKLIYNYDGLIVNRKTKTKQSLSNLKSISTESDKNTLSRNTKRTYMLLSINNWQLTSL